MGLKIDLHAHVLPGSDHGCRDTDMALRQLQMAGEAGIGLVTAVSHFYAHEESADRFLRRRDRSFEMLREAMDSPDAPAGLPRVIPGAEVLVCPGMERMDGLERLCAAGTRCLLLEMPFGKWSRGLVDTMEELIQIPGLRPILAHVDRYSPSAVEELFGMGYCGQLNAEPLARLLPPKHLIRWVKEGHIRGLGSDIHGVSQGYRPWRKAERTLGGHMDRIMEQSRGLLEE